MLFKKEYNYLSNFYLTEIKYEGLTYPSTENAYQASKCINEEDKQLFTNISPAEAKELGKKIEIRNDFDSIKLKIMEDLIRIKFNTRPDLQSRLKSIEVPIVEDNYWDDTFWGVCNGVGENNLGLILEKIKREL